MIYRQATQQDPQLPVKDLKVWRARRSSGNRLESKIRLLAGLSPSAKQTLAPWTWKVQRLRKMNLRSKNSIGAIEIWFSLGRVATLLSKLNRKAKNKQKCNLRAKFNPSSTHWRTKLRSNRYAWRVSTSADNSARKPQKYRQALEETQSKLINLSLSWE